MNIYANLLQGGELWFVYVLFLIFVIWPPLLHKTSRKSCVFVIFVLLVSDIALPSGFLNDIFMYKRVIHFSIFFLTGYMIRDFDRDKLGNKRIFATLTVLFVVFNCVLVETVRIPIVGGYVLSAIGCSFVWMLSYKLSKIRQLAVPLQFVGRYSLPFYWLNGFALVLSRTLVVKILHFDNSVLIVVSIFLLCVFLETLAVLCIRKLPFVGRLIGM